MNYNDITNFVKGYFFYFTDFIGMYNIKAVSLHSGSSESSVDHALFKRPFIGKY